MEEFHFEKDAEIKRDSVSRRTVFYAAYRLHVRFNYFLPDLTTFDHLFNLFYCIYGGILQCQSQQDRPVARFLRHKHRQVFGTDMCQRLEREKSGIRLSPKHYLFSSLKSHTLWLQLIHLLRFPCREIIQHTLIFCVMTVNFKKHRKPV